ncbi:DUF4013 domain-containing protein [Methanobrevibacter olleyae]|uniref:DUF4013 domain-containing protein n=1 Tax=Methanobrevibacter olleyae TaxID=294671 RepID=A0A126R1U3_METOL|nr:DUF4013 domain-containing protein [Methanobrevibacter olleyae]AMK15585.1 hypothetical protein YLM1_1028 [Methanobrevibacter olleyae]
MEIMEIITESLRYPINNIKALVIYVVLCIVAFFALIITGVGIGIVATTDSVALAGGLGIIGIIIAFAVLLLIAGYILDVIKIAINREDGAPEIDPVRQIINGAKLVVVSFVYMIIPIILMAILAAINEYLAIVGIIIFIFFALALMMGQCRLAKTESLGYALNIGEALKDISEIGIVKVLLVIIIVGIIGVVLSLIGSLIAQYSEIIGGILTSIFSVYIAFFQNRAYGLLYSDIE